MEKPWDWVRTLVVQLALCFALFFALKLGQPQKSVYINTSESRHRDLHFISVRGGFRPVNQQTHLLKQLEKVAKTYKARFVVNVGEFGEDDPLVQNATRIVPSLKIPCSCLSDTTSPLPVDLFFNPLPTSLVQAHQAETKEETTSEAQEEAQKGRPKRTLKKPGWLSDYES